MYKRAFLFSSNARITLDDHDGESKKNKNTDTKIELEPNEEENEVEPDHDSIKSHPGNKASYCVFCKGKTFLNKESVDKHLKSKSHLKNVKKNKKESNKADEIKLEFLKRMKEVDEKSL